MFQVIQRQGSSRGFGAGNIKALALSIILMAKEKELEEEDVRKPSLVDGGQEGIYSVMKEEQRGGSEEGVSTSKG